MRVFFRESEQGQGALGRAAVQGVVRQETTTVPFIPLWIEQ
jgi:hypothetical protein